jgi:uroporphyrinogen III methyltransferase/synthase
MTARTIPPPTPLATPPESPDPPGTPAQVRPSRVSARAPICSTLRPVPGLVSIVGAGPWDPELLTLAGRDRLARADVVVADYLVNPALLMHCRQGVQLYQRTHSPHSSDAHGQPVADQDEIHRLLLAKAGAGLHVVRLKGGDPMVFGRGAEEAQVLREAGIAYEFVPGVSASIAAAEAAGIPVTHRDHSPSVTIASGYEAYEKGGRSVDWEHLARGTGTLVLMMSVKNCRENAERLIAAGRDPGTPLRPHPLGHPGDPAHRRRPARPARRPRRRRGHPPARRHDRRQRRRPPRHHPVVRAAPPLRPPRRRHPRRPARRRAHPHARRPRRRRRRLPLPRHRPPDDLDAVDHAVRALDDVDGVILSSPNGVRAWFDALASTGVDVRILHGKCIAAIGTGTAAACWERGIRPDLVPHVARAEGLVDDLRARDMLARRWLHVRADEGRDLLGEAITAAGGTTTSSSATASPAPPSRPMLTRSLLAPSAAARAATPSASPAARPPATSSRPCARPTATSSPASSSIARSVLALGPVTAAAIAALGVRVDHVAESTDDRAMLATVLTAPNLDRHVPTDSPTWPLAPCPNGQPHLPLAPCPNGQLASPVPSSQPSQPVPISQLRRPRANLASPVPRARPIATCPSDSSAAPAASCHHLSRAGSSGLSPRQPPIPRLMGQPRLALALGLACARPAPRRHPHPDPRDHHPPRPRPRPCADAPIPPDTDAALARAAVLRRCNAPKAVLAILAELLQRDPRPRWAHELAALALAEDLVPAARELLQTTPRRPRRPRPPPRRRLRDHRRGARQAAARPPAPNSRPPSPSPPTTPTPSPSPSATTSPSPTASPSASPSPPRSAATASSTIAPPPVPPDDPHGAALFAASCARVSLAAHEPGEARRRFALALTLDPQGEPAPRLTWAAAELAAGNDRKAAELYAPALEAPAAADRYLAGLGLGVARTRLHDPTGAAQAYRHAAAARGWQQGDPPAELPPELQFNLGSALAGPGDPTRRAEARALLRAYVDRPDADELRRLRCRQLLLELRE